MNSPCTEEEYVKQYNALICSGVHRVYVHQSADYCLRLDYIMRDHNTSDYWDPHHCTNSCQDPGYGCTSCTNPEYFQCTRKNQSICIHPDLHCNHHPDCDDAEDEKFEDCKNKYVERHFVEEFATLRCQSRIYPNMETVATVCDDIIECHHGEDEPLSCKTNDGNIYLAVSVFSILAIYLGLRYYFDIINNKQSNRKQIQFEFMLLNTKVRKEMDITALRQRVNCLCLHIREHVQKKNYQTSDICQTIGR